MISKVKISGYRIFQSFEFHPNEGFNLIVGANESGKSTLMESMILALTGRLNGRRAADDLNPFWFNKSHVQAFLEARKSGIAAPPPEIHIEVFLQDRGDLQRLTGAINSDVPTNACPGVALSVVLNPEFADDFELWANNPSPILPIEYYSVVWRSFADDPLLRRPRPLATAIIDSRTVRSTAGIDFHLRDILNDFLEPAERAAISLAFRQSRENVASPPLDEVNARISAAQTALHDKPITLAVDQSARASWQNSIAPHVDGVPFAMSGQGQQAAIKISLAMHQQQDKANIVMIEEPENHLAYPALVSLVSKIEHLAADGQQVFIATHNSFLLNRLRLDRLFLMGPGNAPRIPEMDPSTANYFQKLPGYDTLRIALSKKLVLVEGPSDEIIFERIYRDKFGASPLDHGTDVLSMKSLSAAKCLELCAALDKVVAVVLDNDGAEPETLRTSLAQWLVGGRREVFIGDVASGRTLEPQLVHANGEPAMRSLLGITDHANLTTWMGREKTEGALRIATSTEALNPPAYLSAAAEFIHAQ